MACDSEIGVSLEEVREVKERLRTSSKKLFGNQHRLETLAEISQFAPGETFSSQDLLDALTYGDDSPKNYYAPLRSICGSLLEAGLIKEVGEIPVRGGPQPQYIRLEHPLWEVIIPVCRREVAKMLPPEEDEDLPYGLS